MTQGYFCDECKKPITRKEIGGKAMIYKGEKWRGKGSYYKHFHYCKECFEKLYPDFKNKEERT